MDTKISVKNSKDHFDFEISPKETRHRESPKGIRDLSEYNVTLKQYTGDPKRSKNIIRDYI